MAGVRILVDADACPVKDEIYKVAWRREVPVSVVSNSHLRVPDHPLIERVVVSDGFDAADDWIAERADARTVVVTGDITQVDLPAGIRSGLRVVRDDLVEATADDEEGRPDDGEHEHQRQSHRAHRRALGDEQEGQERQEGRPRAAGRDAVRIDAGITAAIALASLCACAGYTNGSPTAGGPDSGVGLGLRTAVCMHGVLAHEAVPSC